MHFFFYFHCSFGRQINSRITQPWLNNNFIFKKTNLAAEIRQLKAETLSLTFGDEFEKYHNSQASSAGSFSFFEWMKKASMTFEEIKESTFFFVGPNIATTSLGIANTLFLLATNQRVQDKLYEELKSILQSGRDSVTKDDLMKMSYMTLVIKEGMRLLPTTYLQGRNVTKPLKLKKFTLPEGTFASIPTLEIHTDQKLWGDDVLEFKPERFECENMEKVHPYAYIPFSQGPRICPGIKFAMMLLKIFLSRFLMEYKVNTDMKYEDLSFIMLPTLSTKQSLMLFCEKR